MIPMLWRSEEVLKVRSVLDMLTFWIMLVKVEGEWIGKWDVVGIFG